MKITYKTILIQLTVFIIVAIILSVPTYVFASNELLCMAKNIYFESRGEPEAGMFTVGFVTMNRVRDKRWPNTICKVVYQSGQFEWVHNNHSNTPKTGKLYNRMIEIASIVMQSIETQEYGYYFNTTHSKNKSTVVIGGHRFYD